jgi:hypothetical protein
LRPTIGAMQLASVLAPLAVENYKGQIFCWKKQEHRYLLFSFFQNKPSFQASQPTLTTRFLPDLPPIGGGDMRQWNRCRGSDQGGGDAAVKGCTWPVPCVAKRFPSIHSSPPNHLHMILLLRALIENSGSSVLYPNPS